MSQRRQEIRAAFSRQVRRYSRYNVKVAILQRDNGAYCRYCGKPNWLKKLTLDHVIPKSKGGGSDISNLVLACKACNNKKGDAIWTLPPVREPKE